MFEHIAAEHVWFRGNKEMPGCTAWTDNDVIDPEGDMRGRLPTCV